MEIKIPKPKARRRGFLCFGPSLNAEKDFFLENLSLMVDAGIPLPEILQTLINQGVSPAFKKRLFEIQESINNGLPLWESFKNAKLLPEYTLLLIKIGEESGNLLENLKVASEQHQKDVLLRSRIKSALLYPSFVTFLMLIISSGIAWFILPRLSSVFTNLRLDLPLPTKILISFGQFLQFHGLYVIPLFFVFLVLAFYYLFIYPKTRSVGQKFLFFLPGVRTLIQESEISRLGYMVSSMLNTGVPIVQAMHLLEESTSFSIYKDFYGYLKNSLDEGYSFKESFKKYPNSYELIPEPLQEMITSSQQSGKLKEVFLKIAKIFEEKSSSTSKNLSVILEPVLLVVVWVGVVGMALSIVLPLYKLVGGLESSVSNPKSINEVGSLKKPAGGQVKGVTKAEAEIISEPKVLNNQFAKVLPLAKPYLKIRSEPNTKSEQVGKALPGEIVDVLLVSGDWLNVKNQDRVSGWVFYEYVTILD